MGAALGAEMVTRREFIDGVAVSAASLALGRNNFGTNLEQRPGDNLDNDVEKSMPRFAMER